MKTSKLKVVFEEYVIPHYRVAFFSQLAKKVELTVVVSKDREVDGLKKIDDVPFKLIYLEARPESGLYHPDILKVIEENKANVLISFSTSLDLMLNNKEILEKIKKLNLKIMWCGCDGYMVRHFTLHLIRNLILPWRTLRTIKQIIAKSRTNFFMTYSTHTLKYLHYSMLVPIKKILVAQNAIDTSKLHETYKKESQTILRDPYRIVFSGRLSERKAVNKLIEAFAEILPEFPCASLEIIGEGSQEESLKEKTKNLNINNKVKFSGPIYDDQEMAKHLSHASLFVMPGLGGLGFNTAMACGLPIIYTHADGTEDDILTDGVNGWFFDGTSKDLALKIKTALKDQNLIEKGKTSEKLITEKFTVENMVNSYIKGINKAVAHKYD